MQYTLPRTVRNPKSPVPLGSRSMALEFYPNCAILSENKLPRYFFLYGPCGLGANFALLRGLCGQGLVLSPKIAVPMRTQVEPSSIATSKSCDMPMESTFKC